MVLVSIPGSGGNIRKGKGVALGLFLFQLQGRRCNFNCFMSMTWQGQRKDANAFCTYSFSAVKCQAQQISVCPDPAADFPVTGTRPSLSLPCSEKFVKFEEAILDNNPSQQIISLRKRGAWKEEPATKWKLRCGLSMLYYVSSYYYFFGKSLYFSSVFLKHLEFWSGI